MCNWGSKGKTGVVKLGGIGLIGPGTEFFNPPKGEICYWKTNSGSDTNIRIHRNCWAGTQCVGEFSSRQRVVDEAKIKI
jgi:hypothetical protein